MVMVAIRRIEWQTAGLMAGCYAVWIALTAYHDVIPLWLALPLLAVTIAFHTSLQHETIHGHPTPWVWLNEALAQPPLILYVPYQRYRDTHRQHHVLEHIADPLYDPESCYLTPAQWRQLPRWQRSLRQFNNTLLGRILIGPALSVAGFLHTEYSAIRAGDKRILQAWLAYLPMLAAAIAWLAYWQFPLLPYLLACYAAQALLSIRTFAEHQAAMLPEHRSIVVESQGFFSLLFLNNSLHAVHHTYPGLPWYQLRARYQQERAAILHHNGGYVLSGYRELFRRHLLSAKESVAHPLR